MKKSLKFLSAGILTMGMAFFAACGANDPEPGATNQEPAQNQENQQNQADTQEETTIRSLTEGTSLSVLTWDRGGPGHQNSADNYFTRWIQAQILEELGMNIEFVSIGRWAEHEELPLLFATGMVPDLAMTWAGGMVSLFGTQGGILDLNPLLTQYLPLLPDLDNWLDDLLWQNQDPVTGQVFSIFQRRSNVPRTGTFIREDWLDTLGIPLPTTHEEFVDALRAFRDNADALGVSNMIPLAMTQDIRWRASTLLESFVDLDSMTDEDMFAHHIGDRLILFPGYMEGARLLNQMFNEGLIFQDFALMPDDSHTDNLTIAGQVGAYIHNWDNLWRSTPGIAPMLLEADPNARFVPIDPFPNPQTGLTQKITYEAHGFHVFLPATSTNAIGALAYLDWMSRLENRLFLQVGEEGYHHEIINVSGYNVPVMLPFDNEGPRRMYSPQNIDLTLVVNGVDLGSFEANAAAASLAFDPIVPFEWIQDSFLIALYNGRQMPIFTVGNMPHNAEFAPVFQEMASDLLANAITAPTDQFETVWNTGIQNILNAGAQRAIDERRDALQGILAEE